MDEWSLASLSSLDGGLAGAPLCSGCGAAGYQGDKYCACCGRPFSPLCVACGAQILQPVANYCTQCGSMLTRTEAVRR